MGLFKKIFKSTEEGLIESYLETYKKIKNSSQYKLAAECFSEETKMPKEFHYVNTAVASRRYKQYQKEILLERFGNEVGKYIKKNNYISERQMLICLLTMAHEEESGNYDLKFESISNQYISKYFDKDELADEIDIIGLKKLLNDV